MRAFLLSLLGASALLVLGADLTPRVVQSKVAHADLVLMLKNPNNLPPNVPKVVDGMIILVPPNPPTVPVTCLATNTNCFIHTQYNVYTSTTSPLPKFNSCAPYPCGWSYYGMFDCCDGLVVPAGEVSRYFWVMPIAQSQRRGGSIVH